MAIDSINGVSPVTAYYREPSVATPEPNASVPAPVAPTENTSADSAGKDSSNKENGNEQITTVTTHCDKAHQHTPACPHTVSTRPAPQQGRPGSRLDLLV